MIRSLHLVGVWVLFENVMSLHRAKATLMGLLEVGRVKEWVVTDKLGDALKLKSTIKILNMPQFLMGQRCRLHMLELGTGAYLMLCGLYSLTFGTDPYFALYLYAQAIAFFLMGFGYVGTFVPPY